GILVPTVSATEEIIIGTDEAGRGCLAGSVYAAAVILSSGDEQISQYKDSKLIKPDVRERLFQQITTRHRFGIGIATVEEITLWNILRASQMAMYRAIMALNLTEDESTKAHVMVDGHLPIPKLPFKQTPVIGGDNLIKAISAASILAKV